MLAEISFRSSLFQKAGRDGRGKAPFSPSTEGEIPQMIPKDQEGRQNVPVGRFGEGEPYQGVPRRTQSCSASHQTINRAAGRSGKTLRLAGAVFRFGWIRGGSCRNFFEIAAAGTSAGGLRAAFPSFWVAPEARRDKSFAFCGKRGGLCPPPASLLKKAGPKT